MSREGTGHSKGLRGHVHCQVGLVTPFRAREHGLSTV